MTRYEASAEILAPAAVWRILIDGPGLTTWDSGIERLEGTIKAGGTIRGPVDRGTLVLRDDLFFRSGPCGPGSWQRSVAWPRRQLQASLELGLSATPLKLYSDVGPGRAYKLKVVRFTVPHQMVWKGGMPFGLFTGERTFTLTERHSATTFHMQEEFSGPLAPMITKSIPDLGPSFAKFARGLKDWLREARRRDDCFVRGQRHFRGSLAVDHSSR